jgi:PAS domain S-box-containing protein
VYLPVYREGEPQGTAAERRRALRGFVVGFFKWDGLLDGVFGGGFDPAIDFEVYDSQDVASSLPLYDSDGVRRAGNGGNAPLFSEESSIEVAGREWSLYFATLPGFEEEAGSDLPGFVLASGAAVSLLLFGITWMLVRSRTRAERISTDLAEANKELEAFSSEAQTRYRTLVEQIPAITYVQEPLESSNPKAITYMSPQYETILGYHPELKVLDEEHWLRILHPEDRGRVLAEEARTDESGEPFKMEYRVIAKDGRVVWLRDEATLVRDEEGRPLYWLGVQYDITEQKQEAQERERIEQELKVARLIQQTLLPKSVPELPGYDVAAHYRPAREVGGDFYDFLELPEGRLGLVIGDVSGHGIPAALMMANTQSVLRAVAQRGGSKPGRILAEVNEALWTHMPPSMFVTCFYGLLDPESGSFRYANAGHNLPYCHQEGMAIELRATGMPLGLMPAMSYEQKEITLKPGESVLLYSDGLVEAHNPRGEMFGTPRMQGFVGAHPGGAALIDALLAELERFTGEQWEQEDDITLLTLQRSRS